MNKEFKYKDNFPLKEIDCDDKRYMGRTNMTLWNKQVERLMADIEQRGQTDPVGIARLQSEEDYIVIYGFTRTEAIIRLGWDAIRANIYDGLTKHDASILNATNNSMHNQLTNWERALQIKKMKRDGVKVSSSNDADTICSIYGMSRRSVYQWLKVVDYDCAKLHKAIGDESIGLKHALKFVDYPSELTIEMLEKCLEEEWTSKILDLRLKSATVAQKEALSGISKSECATVAQKEALSGISQNECATVAQTDKVEIKRNLDKAANLMLESTADKILSLSEEQQAQLNKGLRMILEVLMRN